MRVRALAAALAVATAAGGLMAGTASAAVSPATSLTSLGIEGAPGNYPLDTRQSRYYPGNQMSVTPSATGVQVYAGSWQLGLFFPSSGVAPGTYPLAEVGQASSSQMSVSFSGEGRGCSGFTGTAAVYEATVTDGTISTLSATLSLACGGTSEPMAVDLRYNSAVDADRFGQLPLGTDSAPHTVTVTASAPTTFGTAVVEGVSAKSFTKGADTCSGATLATGATCTVVVSAHPLTESGLAADLRIPADTGARFVGLTAGGFDTASGTYTSLQPSRILDTRKRVGVPTTTPLGQGSVMDVQAVNVGGLPTGGIASVVLSLTAVTPTAAGYITAYPSGSLRPSASSISFAAHTTTANLVTVPLGSNGKFRLYNYAGATHIVADVVGYYHSKTTAPVDVLSDSAFQTVKPYRALDTRTPGVGALPGGYYYRRWFDYGADFNPRIRAFAVNVTVVGPQSSGYLTAWDGQSALPMTSTLNFTKGATVASMAIVKTAPCSSDCGSDPSLPQIAFLNGSPGALHLVVDVVGVYFEGVEGDRGWRYRALPNPTRFIDSRKGQGLVTNITAGATRTLVVPPSVAGYNTCAVVSNLTLASPTARTYLTLWQNNPADARPDVSNINANPGQVVSNAAITGVWTQNDIQIYNSAGTSPVIADAAGTMETYPARVVPPGETPVAPSAAAARPDRLAAPAGGGSAIVLR